MKASLYQGNTYLFSDGEDIFKNIETKTKVNRLSTPEYMSFEELAAMMVDVPCRPSGAVKITILDEGNSIM